jgi:hypothetical protein
VNRLPLIGEPAAYGSYAGYLYIDEAHPTCEAATIEDYDLPEGNQHIFLELDYRCNQSFSLGIRGLNTGQQIEDSWKLTLTQKDQWNKVYVQFSAEVANLNDESYQILIRADHELTTPGEIFIDNVKLLYQEL